MGAEEIEAAKTEFFKLSVFHYKHFTLNQIHVLKKKKKSLCIFLVYYTNTVSGALTVPLSCRNFINVNVWPGLHQLQALHKPQNNPRLRTSSL